MGTETKKMSKRLLSHYKHDCNNNNNSTILLYTKEEAEQICQKKLRQVRRLKTNLYATVLVRNTLKYVQSCTNFSVSTGVPAKYEEYQPFQKKSCRDISSEDIDKILNEISFANQLSPKKINEKKSKFCSQDAFEFIDEELLVPEIDIFEFPSDEGDFYDNTTDENFNTITTKFDSIWNL